MADQQTPSTAIPIKVVIVDQGGAFVPAGAVTIADNGNAVEGALADAAIVTNSAGSISGKLRGIVALLAGGISVSWAAAQHVITDATSVTNATLSAETTKVIGTVNQGTSPWVVSGAVTLASTSITGTVSTKTPLTASAPTAVSVGVSSAQVLAANANRKGVTLINTSANNISFGIGASAVLNSGITLTPNGVWEMDEFTFSTGSINAIAAGAASNLAVQEFTT